MQETRTVATAEDIGALIKRKRKELGLSQKELSMYCNVGTTFLSHLENGKETAELGKTLKVIQRLGLDVSVSER